MHDDRTNVVAGTLTGATSRARRSWSSGAPAQDWAGRIAAAEGVSSDAR